MTGSAPAALYCRISKDEAGEGLGVERQRKLCEKLARQRGLDVVEVLIDNDVSAFRKDVRRPAFERLVEMLKNSEAGHVVVYHVDRLYRRMGDLERLVEIVEVTGAQVHTVAAGEVDLSQASGRMVARMLGAAAQHESERTSERMKLKQDELAAAGRAPGGRPPYGYRRATVVSSSGAVERRYVVDEGEATVVRLIAERLLEGGSLLGVGRELEAKGIRTQGGHQHWPATTVRATVTNPAVAGLRVHRREVAGEGDWEAILDRPTWEQVCAVISDPARKRQRPVRKHLLSGMVVDESGVRMMGVTASSSSGGGRRPVYRTHWAVPPPAGQRVITQVGAEDLERHLVEAVLAVADANAPRRDEIDVVEAGGPADEVVAIQVEIDELGGARGRGEISLREYLTISRPLGERLEAAKRAAGSGRARRMSSKVEALVGEPGALRRAWERDALTFDEKREALGMWITSVTVLRCTAGRWTAIEDRVVVDWRM